METFKERLTTEMQELNEKIKNLENKNKSSDRDLSKWLYDNRTNFDKYPAYMKYEELYKEFLNKDKEFLNKK